MAPYPYDALNLPHETRILHIEPGGYDDEIVCSLLHMSLDKDTQPYEALSYCWGKSVNFEVDPPDDAMVSYAYGPGEDEQGSIPFRDMLDHKELHRMYINFGGKLPPGTILCDGVKVEVGGELHRAMRRIRSQDKTLRIWIDALCIDQSNIEEKSRHVLMMGSIYAGASHVRIWLGEETGIEGPAVAVLDSILEIANEACTEKEVGTISDFEIRKRIMLNPKTAQLDWESLHTFFNRAWFQRIWVVQEAANAAGATVHIGDGRLDWHWLNSALHFAKNFKMDTVIQSFALKSTSVMEWLRKTRANGKGPISVPLLDALEETRVFQSTLASDKVYGILSMAENALTVTPDYTLSAEEVFTSLTVDFLTKKQSLDILYHCMLPATPSKLNVPSWVADWTVHGWVEPFRSRGLDANAAGDTQARFNINKNDGVLSIWGKVIGSIAAIEQTKTITSLDDSAKTVGAPRYGTREIDPTVEDLAPNTNAFDLEDRNSRRHAHKREEARDSLYDVHRVASPSGTPSHDVREALARTFACNRKRDGSSLGEDFQRGFDFHTMVTCTDDTFETVYRWMINEFTGANEISREGRAFGKKIMKALEEVTGSHFRWCFNRRFIRTSNNDLGWTVNGAQVGDVIAVFYGASYPFVLREEEGKYRIVGDCYIDQHMEGEAMASQYPEQVFDIV